MDKLATCVTKRKQLSKEYSQKSIRLHQATEATDLIFTVPPQRAIQ